MHRSCDIFYILHPILERRIITISDVDQARVSPAINVHYAACGNDNTCVDLHISGDLHNMGYATRVNMPYRISVLLVKMRFDVTRNKATPLIKFAIQHKMDVILT